jgi:hypothetical protein
MPKQTRPHSRTICGIHKRLILSIHHKFSQPQNRWIAQRFGHNFWTNAHGVAHGDGNHWLKTSAGLLGWFVRGHGV